MNRQAVVSAAPAGVPVERSRCRFLNKARHSRTSAGENRPVSTGTGTTCPSGPSPSSGTCREPRARRFDDPRRARRRRRDQGALGDRARQGGVGWRALPIDSPGACEVDFLGFHGALERRGPRDREGRALSFHRKSLVLTAALGLALWAAGAPGASIPSHALGYDPADGPPTADDQHGGVGAQGTSVHIVNIANPASPSKVGFIPAHANSYVGEGVHVIHMSTPYFTGDILVHNNEICDSSLPGEGGVSLWDVSNPLTPVKFVGGVGDSTPAISPNINGVHTVHSAFAWYVPGANPPATGKAYVMMADNQEVADVDILDITNPAAPVMASETGLNDWPAAQSPLANGDTVFNHDFQVKKIGTRWIALNSYWDAGWVKLDVTNPAAPVFINDSDYPTPDPLTGFAIPEGNGHQAWFSSNNQFILGTDEDFSPTRTNCRIETGASAGATPCGEFGWTVPLATQFPSGFSGTTVWGGSGCEEDVDGNGTGDRDEVLANYTKAQTGADAIVFSRGTCFFSKKVETGELAGYKMVFVGQRD